MIATTCLAEVRQVPLQLSRYSHAKNIYLRRRTSHACDRAGPYLHGPAIALSVAL